MLWGDNRISKTPHRCRFPLHGANRNRRNILAIALEGESLKRVGGMHTPQGVGVLTLDRERPFCLCNRWMENELRAASGGGAVSGRRLAVQVRADVTGRRADGPLINLERLTVRGADNRRATS